MTTAVQIDFQLLGTTIPPSEISRLTGITPEVELLQGERNKALNLPRLNIWSIRSHAQSEEVSDHWRDLEGVLNASRGAIRDVARTGRAKLTLIVKDVDRIPPIAIPPAMAEFAGFVNAVIDIDHIQGND